MHGKYLFMNQLKIRIKSERLILVPISKKHAKDIFREFNEEITNYMIPKPQESVQKVEEWIADSLRRMRKGSNLQLVIIEKQTGEFLGCAGLHEVNTKTPELGVWIKKSGHRKKYGQEAMRALKNWADGNLKYDYIKYPVATANTASRKVAESLGGKEAARYDETTQNGKTWQFIEYRIDDKLRKNRNTIDIEQYLAEQAIRITTLTSEKQIEILRDRTSFNYTYDNTTIELLKKNFTLKDSLYLLAKQNNKFVGFCSTDRDWWEDNFFFVREILVDSDFQNSGIGRQFMLKCIEHAKSKGAMGIVTETDFENIPMRKLCESLHFKAWKNPRWKDGITYKLLFKRNERGTPHTSPPPRASIPPPSQDTSPDQDWPKFAF